MGPLHTRIALVGHIRATSPRVSGYLQPAAARVLGLEALPDLRERIKDFKEAQGTITYRLIEGKAVQLNRSQR